MPHCPLTSYHIWRAAAEQESVSESGVRTAMSIRGRQIPAVHRLGPR